MIVSVIGLGYIGLPTAAILAKGDTQVVGVDINQEAVEMINQGQIHIIEPELEDLVYSAVQSGNLTATIKPEKSDVFVIAVPTPFKGKNQPDLSFVKSAILSISKVLEKGNLVILESTSPVGTTEKVVQWMREARPDLSFPSYQNNNLSDISVAYCPERVLPGRILHELTVNDRIIGGINLASSEKARDLYKNFVRSECHISDCRTAELAKLVENSFRDVNIAFANELSLICNKLNVNVWSLIELANHHPRVNILNPGPGVGGHCIAVDPWFIIDSAKEESKLIHMARSINNSMPAYVVKKIYHAIEKLDKSPKEITIACLGLSFKADINDLRESPALDISLKVNLMNFKQQYVVEPNIRVLPNSFQNNSVELVELDFAIIESDVIILLVDHSIFKHINLSLLSGKQVIDTRGIWR
jgi:UDP-N-acetyl-D-mannosaminuronic acid dehydrogenase